MIAEILVQMLLRASKGIGREREFASLLVQKQYRKLEKERKSEGKFKFEHTSYTVFV